MWMKPKGKFGMAHVWFMPSLVQSYALCNRVHPRPGYTLIPVDPDDTVRRCRECLRFQEEENAGTHNE